MERSSIHIVVVDDGINQDVDNIIIYHNIEITEDLSIKTRKGYDSRKISHGTMCAREIVKLAPAALISSVKVLGKESRGKREQLERAIVWCMDNQVDIISMSLGTVDFNDFRSLKRVVNLAVDTGVVIVAACNNLDIVTYPASLTNVIGVCYDRSKSLDEGEYYYHQNSANGIKISTTSDSYFADDGESLMGFGPSNSFATPKITAFVHNIMQAQPEISFKELNRVLMEGAKNYRESVLEWNRFRRIDWVESAVLFSISMTDEGYQHVMFCFDVVQRHDMLVSEVGEGLKKIRDLLKAHEGVLEEIDSLVVVIHGNHADYAIEDVNELVDLAVEHDKNLVYVDDSFLEKDLYQSLELGTKEIKVWYPDRLDDIRNHTGEPNIPVIAVYDASGKYLVGVIGYLLKLFRKEGYRAQAVSNMALGVLADFEFCSLEDLQGMTKCMEAVYYLDLLIVGVMDSGEASNLEVEVDIDIVVVLENLKDRRECNERTQIILAAQDFVDNPDSVMQKIHEQITRLYGI